MALFALASATLSCLSGSAADPWLWFYDYQSDYRSPVVLYEVAADGKPNPTQVRPSQDARPYVHWLGGAQTVQKTDGRSVTGPDGQTAASPSQTAVKAKNSIVVKLNRSEGAPRSLTLGMIQQANRKVNPTGGRVHHVAWSPRGSQLALCMTGSRRRDAAGTCPEYLTYTWDLKSNQVRYIGPGFKAVWRNEDRLAITGYADNLPGKFGQDLSQRPLPMFSALYTADGQPLALVENMSIQAYSQSRGVFIGFSPSGKEVAIRQISPNLKVLPKWRIATKNIQWNAEFFYQYGMTAR